MSRHGIEVPSELCEIVFKGLVLEIANTKNELKERNEIVKTHRNESHVIMKTKRKMLAAAAIALVLGAGISAQATLLQVIGLSDSSTSVGISYPGGSIAPNNAYIGVYDVGVYGGTLSSPGGLESSWNTVCLSPGGEISGYESVTEENFGTASPGQFPSSWSPDGIYNAAYLYNTYISSVNNATQGTALALAMYKALYDSTGYGTLDAHGNSLSSGSFQATGLTSTMSSDYLSYISAVNTVNINSGNYYVGSLYYVGSDPTTGTGQEFILTGIPIPEPTTLIAGTMLLLPFGASTLRFMRRSVRV